MPRSRGPKVKSNENSTVPVPPVTLATIASIAKPKRAYTKRLTKTQLQEIEEAIKFGPSFEEESSFIRGESKNDEELNFYLQQDEENKELMRLFFEWLETEMFSGEPKPELDPTDVANIFICASVPDVKLFDFYNSLITRLRLDHSMGIFALILISKIKELRPTFELHAYNANFLLVAALGALKKICSDKDRKDRNKEIAEFLRLKSTDYNEMEVTFLQLINFDFFITLQRSEYELAKTQIKNIPSIKLKNEMPALEAVSSSVYSSPASSSNSNSISSPTIPSGFFSHSLQQMPALTESLPQAQHNGDPFSSAMLDVPSLDDFDYEMGL